MTTTQMKAAMSNAKPFVPNKMDFPSLGDDDTNSTECNSPLVSCSSGSPKTESINASPENSTKFENQGQSACCSPFNFNNE